MRCYSGRLWYGEPNGVANANGKGEILESSHYAAIRVYYAARDVTETQDEHTAISQSSGSGKIVSKTTPFARNVLGLTLQVTLIFMI